MAVVSLVSRTMPTAGRMRRSSAAA
jgi:hypothetical protein